MRNYPLFDGTQTVHEDELPDDMTEEDYASWYPLSRVDFVRVGPKPIGPSVQTTAGKTE